jgi:hypothetical protein
MQSLYNGLIILFTAVNYDRKLYITLTTDLKKNYSSMPMPPNQTDSLVSKHKFGILKGHLHKTAKIGPIFVVRLNLPGCPSDFCKHLTDGHHIAQNQTER